MPLAKKTPKKIFPTTKQWRIIQFKTREYYTDTTSLLNAELKQLDAEFTHLEKEQLTLNARQDAVAEQLDYDEMCLESLVQNEKFLKTLEKKSLDHAKKHSDGSLCGIFDYRNAPSSRWPVPDSLRHSGTYWKVDDKWGVFSAKHGKVTKTFSTVGNDNERTIKIATHFARYGKVKKFPKPVSKCGVDIGALNKALKNTNYKVVSTK